MTTIISFIVALLVAMGGWYFYQGIPQSGSTKKNVEQGIDSSQTEPALTSMDRNHRGLTEMPGDILSMTYLQKLDLSNNDLTGALPAEIRHLRNLEVLDISSNKMTGLPAELGQLSKLRVLNASNNQLTGIPHELGNLQNLEVLDLSGNDIAQQDLKIILERLPASTQVIL